MSFMVTANPAPAADRGGERDGRGDRATRWPRPCRTGGDDRSRGRPPRRCRSISTVDDTTARGRQHGDRNGEQRHRLHDRLPPIRPEVTVADDDATMEPPDDGDPPPGVIPTVSITDVSAEPREGRRDPLSSRSGANPAPTTTIFGRSSRDYPRLESGSYADDHPRRRVRQRGNDHEDTTPVDKVTVSHRRQGLDGEDPHHLGENCSR